MLKKQTTKRKSKKGVCKEILKNIIKGRATRRQSKLLYWVKTNFTLERVYVSHRFKSTSIVRNMHDYTDFPPIDSFKKVLRTSPQSALIFASLWKLKTNTNRLSFRREDIKKTFLISPTLFRNHLLALGRLDVLSFEETSAFFIIDFYELDERYV